MNRDGRSPSWCLFRRFSNESLECGDLVWMTGQVIIWRYLVSELRPLHRIKAHVMTHELVIWEWSKLGSFVLSSQTFWCLSLGTLPCYSKGNLGVRLKDISWGPTIGPHFYTGSELLSLLSKGLPDISVSLLSNDKEIEPHKSLPDHEL